MNDILTTLKAGLAQHLEKQGSSLAEFEQSLSDLDKIEGAVKTASILEMLASAGGGLAKGVGGAAAAIPELGLLSAIGVGSGLGAGAHFLGKHMDKQDESFKEKETEQQRIRSLTERLKSDYGIG